MRTPSVLPPRTPRQLVTNESRLRLLTGHFGAGYHAWWFDDEKPVYRDAIGRRNGRTYRWLVLRCADGCCPAKAIVRADVLADLATQRWPGARG
jgi:hypothetical protein